MTECPECGRNIGYLKRYAMYEERFDTWVDNDRLVTEFIDAHQVSGSYPGGKSYRLACPECGTELCDGDLALAMNFLKRGMIR